MPWYAYVGMALVGIIQSLLGVIYVEQRAQMKEMRVQVEKKIIDSNKAIAKVEIDLDKHKERFEKFRDDEMKELHNKLDKFCTEITGAVHKLELAMAREYATHDDVKDAIVANQNQKASA